MRYLCINPMALRHSGTVRADILQQGDVYTRLGSQLYECETKMMYTFRLATRDDEDFLYCLHRATMKDYVDRTWGWDEDIQAGMFKRKFAPSGQQIVVVDGRDVGVISLQQRPDALFLANIQILPEYQGQRLGTAIITSLLAQAAADGKTISLQVLKVNPAQRLYRRLGFSVAGETETHILMSFESQG